MSIETRLDIIMWLLVFLVVGSVGAVVSTVSSIIGVVRPLARLLHSIGRWLLKRKQLMDNTWPVEVICRGEPEIRVLGNTGLSVVVRYILNPRLAPLTIQDVQLRYYAASLPHGQEVKSEDDDLAMRGLGLFHGAKRIDITHKGQTPEFRSVFEIMIPKHIELTHASMQLEVQAEGLSCVATLGEFDLPSSHP